LSDEFKIDDDESMLTRMGVEWLNQYARFLRRTPELVARLAEDTADFELVPVPKKLLDQLAVPGIVGSGSLGGRVDSEIEELLRIGASDEPVVISSTFGLTDGGPAAVASEFGNAIENGSIDKVMELLSPNFLDDDGRNISEVQSAIARLIDETEERRFRIVNMSESRRTARDATVRLAVDWNAIPMGDALVAAISEKAHLELLLERDEHEQWKIVSLKST
jgi:hypothetical protein